MKKIIMLLSIIVFSFSTVIKSNAYDEEYENQNKLLNNKLNKNVFRYANDVTVIIDPGHGGKDSGSVSLDKRYKEKDLNLDIAIAAKNYLIKNNINVIMTRNRDEWIELKERSILSNAVGPSLFVSIHNDTSEGNGNGAHAIYSVKDKNGGESKILANNILNSIVSNTSQNKSSRGAWTRENSEGNDWYHVIREVEAPSVIVECSYMNSTDIKAVDTLAKRNTMGIAIAKGIVKTLDEINVQEFGIDYMGHV